MTTDKWNLFGAHGLRKYIWSILQSELEWSESDYPKTTQDGTTIYLVPIITPGQQPEFNSYNKPYIVYSYSKKQGSDNYFIESEIISFSIYSQDEGDIQRVINLLDAKLDKRDESASDLNDFISKSNLGPRYREFDYKTLWVSSIQGPQPATEEGGRTDGLINVNLNYTHYDESGLAIRY